MKTSDSSAVEGEAPLGPYPGLRSFEAEDHPIFFGRENDLVTMIRRLSDRQFLAVVGASGSGKSSLVRAGFLPVLEEGFLRGEKRWRKLVIRPGDDPYERLARELTGYQGLLPELTKPSSGESPPSTSADDPAAQCQHVRGLLRKTDRGLLNALDYLARDAQTNVMLVVDQFEELFNFRTAQRQMHQGATRDEVAAFVSMLLRTCASRSNQIWVILTMRSEFIGHSEAFLGLPEAISQSQFLVPRLDRKQMERAVCAPGQVSSRHFAPFSFEEGLVTRIINEAGDRPDQLPLMQHALLRTWKRAMDNARTNGGDVILTSKLYEDAGIIEGALDQDANEAWNDLRKVGEPVQGEVRSSQAVSDASDETGAQLVARRLFLLLCKVTDFQITRQPVTVGEVMTACDASLDLVRIVVGAFQRNDRNFIYPEVDASFAEDTWLDISHESLFRNWKLLSGWIQKEVQSAELYRRFLVGAHIFALKPRYRLNEFDTQIAVDWLKQERPTVGWIERYGKGFDTLKQLIKVSEKDLKDEQERAAKTEQERLKQQQAEQERAAKTEQERLKQQQAEQERAAKTEQERLQLELAKKDAELARSRLDAEREENKLRRISQKRRGIAISIISVLLMVVVFLLIAVSMNRSARNELARQESNLVGRAKDALKQQKAPDFTALNLLSRALHVFPGSSEAQEVICPLLLNKNWCLPVTNVVRDDTSNPLLVTASEGNDGKTILAVAADGRLLQCAVGTDDLLKLKLKDVLAPMEPSTPDVTSLNETPPLPHGLPPVATAAFNPTGNKLAVVSQVGFIRLLRFRGDTWESLGVFNLIRRQRGFYRNLVWSNGKETSYLLIISSRFDASETDTQLFRIDKSGVNEVTKQLQGELATCACFTPDDSSLLTLDKDQNLLNWPIGPDGLGTPQRSQTKLALTRPVALSVDSDKKALVVTGWGMDVRGPAWIDLADPTKEPITLFLGKPGATSTILRAVFSSASADQSRLMLVTTNRLEFVSSDKLKDSNETHECYLDPTSEPAVFQGLGSPSFSADGKRVLLVSGPSFMTLDAIRIWDIRPQRAVTENEQQQIIPLGKAPGWVADLAFAITDPGSIPEGDADTDHHPKAAGIFRNKQIGEDQKQGIYGVIWRRFQQPQSAVEATQRGAIQH